MKNPIRVGCISVVVLGVIAVIGFLCFALLGRKGGVRLSNEIEPYALDHLRTNKVLNLSEKVLAYYDATIALDGSEAAVITDHRIVYFNRGTITSIRHEDVVDFKHRSEPPIGDIFEFVATDGTTLRIEVSMWNGGATMKNLLDRLLKERPAPKSGLPIRA